MMNRLIYSVLLGAALVALPSLCEAQGYLITTVAGGGVPLTPVPARSVPLCSVVSVAAGAHGDVYFIASGYVFQMNSEGILTRIAGTSSAGYSGDGGFAANAQINPYCVAVDGSGNVYLADTNNNVIRKVAPATGIISTFAGTGTPGFSGDGGPAASAELDRPDGVALDGFGNLYIADTGRVRKVAAATGIITTVAGGGHYDNDPYSGEGGPATSAWLVPFCVAVDGSGNLYVISLGVVRKVTAATGIITTVAGTGIPGYSGDGGPATKAQFEAGNLAVDGSGDIYIADVAGDVVRKVTAATGIITTVAGSGATGYTGDGGPATSARLNSVSAVAVDGAGNLYLADFYNFVIRKVAAATGIIITVAGNGSAYYLDNGVQATNAPLVYPSGVALDGAGDLFIADTINNVIDKVAAATGIVTTVAGNGTGGYAGDAGPATKAGLNGPTSVSVDGSGNLYIADSGNSAIRKVTTATGIITTVAGNPGLSLRLNGPQGVAVDGSGNVYIADTNNDVIRKVSAATGIITIVAGNGAEGYAGDGGLAVNAELGGPTGVAVDHSGNLYIADLNTNVIRKVVAATGIITTVAGNGSAGYSGDGGPAPKAELKSPAGVAVDGSGNLYIADQYNCSIRKVASATGIITTVAGNGVAGYSGDGGQATNAQISYPYGVTVDGPGNVYIADSANYRIRLLAPEGIRPVLSLAETHAGNFTLGQAGATYSVMVGNAAGAGATSGIVTLNKTVPAGLTLQSMSGAGWSCAANTCTRSDTLSGGTSYPPVTVAVNVWADAPSQATNQVILTGGGQVVAMAASDTTNILTNASAITTVTTVSAASGAAPVTADSIVGLYAANIDTAVFTATVGPPAPLPTTLGGVSATITDSSGTTAPIGLIAVTPSQVNAVLPAGLQTGEATINLMSSSGVQDYGDVALVTVAPALFTADESGGGVAAAEVVIAHRDGSQTFIGAIASCNSSGCTPIPINLGSSTDQAVLELFGTGIRGAGGASKVTVAVGNTQGMVLYSGAQGGGATGYYYGLDQVNVLLPRSLVGSGTVNVVLTAGGQAANTVTMDIQ
jgi:uncharacterized protein (TIGR03437 family)